MKWLVLSAALVAVGCGQGVTEQDQKDVRAEFSQENYERAMKASGREKELAEEKKRNAEHLAGGRSSN